MTGLIRMNAEQMRRKGLENAEAKRQREKDYINQMEKMSKHDVGGLYDIRAIAKSKQLIALCNDSILRTYAILT